jgi:replicative DNA helicase
LTTAHDVHADVFMRTAAVWWASKGVPVLPLHHPVGPDGDLSCSCRKPKCSSPGKHPIAELVPNGLTDASRDAEVVADWWRRYPFANIGLRTGVEFDLLDIDGEAGFTSYAVLTEQLGGAPEAVCVVESGRAEGGRHYYVQPAGKKALTGGLRGVPYGIDVKGAGGYVVAPPSRHISGNRYQWTAPYGTHTGSVPWDRVYDALTANDPAKHRPAAPTPADFVAPSPAGSGKGFSRAVLDRILDEMRDAVSGHRWTVFATQCAFDVARGIEGGTLDRAQAEAELASAAYEAGLDRHEIDRLPKLIDDALNAGITDPIAARVHDGGEPVKPWTADEIDTEGWTPPVPLNRPVPPFPTWTLGWLEDDVLALAEELQTPVDLVAMLTLATLAAAVRGRAYVTVRERWEEPLNLYVVVLAGAGETKSPALGVITKPLRDMEKRLADDAAREVARRRQQIRLQEGRLKKAEQAAISATGEDRQVAEDQAAREREVLEQLPPAVAPRLLAGDTTAEGLVRLLAEQGGVMASLTAEGGLFDTLAGGRYSNGMANLDAVLQAHDGREPILVDRKVGDPIRVERPCLTLGLAVQPHVLEKAGESEAAVGRGFLARFLFSYPESQVGRRDVDRGPSGRGFEDIEYAIEGVDQQLRQGFEDFEDVPLKSELRLTTTTLRYFTAFRADLEPRRGPSGDLASITAWASKLDGQVARLSAVLQLLYNTKASSKSSKPGPLSVDMDAMTAACVLGDYLIEHSIAAHRLMSGRHFSATHPAQQLLSWVRDKGLAEFSLREAHQSLRGRADFTEVEAVEAAAEALCRHDYLRLLAPEKRPGRPSVRYAVNPMEAT